jgi:hypothetical protein
MYVSLAKNDLNQDYVSFVKFSLFYVSSTKLNLV